MLADFRCVDRRASIHRSTPEQSSGDGVIFVGEAGRARQVAKLACSTRLNVGDVDLPYVFYFDPLYGY